MPRRVFIVEDHPVMCEGYAYLIDREADLEVCGTAASGSEAIAEMPRARPDLALVDLSLPDLSGLEVVKQMGRLLPGLAMLVITAHSEELYGSRALEAGAQGFLTKDAKPAEIVAAIRDVLEGKLCLSTKLQEKLIAKAIHGGPRTGVEQLSDRELEVFEYFGRGYTTVTTAEALCLSPKTVESYRANIKAKLQITHSNDLIRHATLWVESLERSP